MYTYKLILIVIISAFLVGCSNTSPSNQVKTVQTSAMVKTAPQQSQAKNQSDNDIFNDDNEQKVIISTSNVGRSDPFKPYSEVSLKKSDIPMIRVPAPPRGPNPNIVKLMAIKVNGILYDSYNSSAILNLDNNDYVVHKGDMLFDYLIKDIKKQKVVIQYENNVYSVGIGQIIGGNVNISPVRRAEKYKVSDTYNIPNSVYPKTTNKLPNVLPQIKLNPPPNYLSPLG